MIMAACMVWTNNVAWEASMVERMYPGSIEGELTPCVS